ncbi:MAG TPA: aldehyde dehydrogenase family protein [Ktedonobacteraceae bacterium]|nr:aldehyde dehydrogenase family protein [Ktedonobacteraceae bacterium]
MDHYPLWINGEAWDTGSRLTVTDKASGAPWATVSQAGQREVDAAITAAVRAFEGKSLTVTQRYDILTRAAALIRSRVDDLALTMAYEAGKPLRDALAEAERAADTFTWAAEEAKRIHGEMVPLEATPGSENRLAFTIRVPVGVVCAITPFNFPINMAAHKIAPALAAGNAVVLKPASYTPIVAAKLCAILTDAGLPPGWLNLLVGSGDSVGSALLNDERIGFYTFTGSVPVGETLKRTIGLRRCTLELGSNAAVIVHADANIANAATQCALKGFSYAGQVCLSVQRILVQRAAVGEFTAKLVDVARGLKIGDPKEKTTDIGPMISEGEARRAEAWIQEAVASGASLLTGGQRQGAYLTPAVLANVQPQMRVVCQETFAPIVTVQTYETLDEALRLANDSAFGLQAGVFTGSLSVAMAAGRGLRVGGVMINDTSFYRAGQMPYGGVKRSGMGREGPRYAIEEMTELRLVVLNPEG